MCGRYTLTSPEDIAARFGLGALAETRIVRSDLGGGPGGVRGSGRVRRGWQAADTAMGKARTGGPASARTRRPSRGPVAAVPLGKHAPLAAAGRGAVRSILVTSAVERGPGPIEDVVDVPLEAGHGVRDLAV